MADQKPSFTIGQAIAFAFTGALIALILMQAKLYAEQRPWWHTLELLAYQVLQTWVPPYDKLGKPLSVVVVDIGKMPGGKDENTSPEALTHLINTVVEQSPLAIAVDIDFSLVDGWYRTDGDPKFFDFCLEQKTKPRPTPIFLGVYENSTVSPDAWLGVPKYKDLAVNIAVDPIKTRRIPLWIQLNGWTDQLPSLSAALANVRGMRPANLPGWLQLAVDTSPKGEDSGYVYADMLVDYTKLDDIKNETVVYTPIPDRPTPVLSKPENLKDRLVILGDVTNAMDSFRVPGRDGEGEFPGVYLHASAVHTLTTHPVFELTSKARHKVEIVVSGLIILGAAFIRYRYRKNPTISRAYQKRLTIACFVLIVVAVIVLVRYYNVFWFDFHLALVGLFLHLKLERVVDKFHHFRQRLKQTRRKQTRRLSSDRS